MGNEMVSLPPPAAVLRNLLDGAGVSAATSGLAVEPLGASVSAASGGRATEPFGSTGSTNL